MGGLVKRGDVRPVSVPRPVPVNKGRDAVDRLDTRMTSLSLLLCVVSFLCRSVSQKPLVLRKCILKRLFLNHVYVFLLISTGGSSVSNGSDGPPLESLSRETYAV